MSIIALPSLTGYGDTKPGETAKSRIVNSLGAEATLDQTMADIVVTEYGVAKLRDASPAQRKERLIAIANPDERERLQQ